MQSSTLNLFGSGLVGGGSPTAASRASSLAGGKRALARTSSSTRSHSAVASLVLHSVPTFVPGSPVAFRVCVTTTFDAQVKVEVRGASPEAGCGLPEVCRPEEAAAATYVANSVCLGGQTQGTLLIQGFEPVPFAVAHTRQYSTFVGPGGRRRYTALRAEPWDWRGGGDRPTEGQAADLEVVAGTVKANLREATAAELRRCLQLQALRDAEKGEDYDTLHAQVTKAKAAGVEVEHIERGEERLKALRKQGLHVHSGCEKESLREMMQWSKVTSRAGARSTSEACSACADCPCNTSLNPGEAFEVLPNAVEECLGPGKDKELFEELLGAALGVEEGSVWKAGGKFIFSAFNRNQSVVALTRMLEKFGKKHCAKMLLDLVRSSEKKYDGYVTAVQINFHPNGETFHDQHRDIYSGKQRAGPNCTCSFRECVGTVCYSLGSSRVCQLDTMVDSTSSVRPCSAGCAGRRERLWLHSGEAMYFNGPWNQNHTHGIPSMDEEAGPRISIAFLLGAQSITVG